MNTVTIKDHLRNLEILRATDLWSEYPPTPRSWWRQDVAADQTQLGYWDWATHRIEVGVLA